MVQFTKKSKPEVVFQTTSVGFYKTVNSFAIIYIRKIKFSRKTANINVKKLSFYNNV